MNKLDLVTMLPEFMQKFLAKKYLEREFRKKVKISVEGRENLDLVKEPTIFIGNHLSNIDAVLYIDLLKERFDPYFVAGVKLNKERLTNLFKLLFKTIDIKPNSADIESMREIINKVKEGNNLVIFPEGTRSRTGAMIEAKKGILLIAKLTKAQIMPISMMGTEKVLPIDRGEDMGKERIHEGEIKIRIGKPFDLPKKEKEEKKEEYEERAMNIIMGSIARNLDEEYRGFYGDKI